MMQKGRWGRNYVKPKDKEGMENGEGAEEQGRKETTESKSKK